MALDTEGMSPPRRRYVESLERVAEFLEAIDAVAEEHGLHIKPTEDGGLAVVDNATESPVAPLRFHWTGTKYEVG